ncbi:MAG TPA: hypothetical protein DEA22_00160 [Blastocatellia bacterium]|nr:hypothetical protein [Blastocatellia bacterium]
MFSFFTQPKCPRAALGVESGALTCVSLRKESAGRFGVDQAATVHLPESILNPDFSEINIANAAVFSEALTECATAAGLLGQQKWSASLPGGATRSAILTVGAGGAGKSESQEIFDWKVEQAFGFPASELRVSSQKISADTDGKTRYFASAVKLAVIDEYETVFESLGWRVGLVLPRAVSESQWLLGSSAIADSLLISGQENGFTAFLLREGEPMVVRSVTCASGEIDDEVYRLLLFYNDRFADDGPRLMDRLLVVGRGFLPQKLREISADALGRPLRIMNADDAGLNVPPGMNFDDLAAPAGLASLAFA